MEFHLAHAIDILHRTPEVLRSLLNGLPEDWSGKNEGGNTWSPYDVLGHLIHGERTDWIPRARIILEDGESRPFDSFDRFAQFEASKGKSLGELISLFEFLRKENLHILQNMNLSPEDLDRTGKHPELGTVTLSQLLATWVVHDLDHIVQIGRTMAGQYRTEVGPWRRYLSIIKEGGKNLP